MNAESCPDDIGPGRPAKCHDCVTGEPSQERWLDWSAPHDHRSRVTCTASTVGLQSGFFPFRTSCRAVGDLMCAAVDPAVSRPVSMLLERMRYDLLDRYVRPATTGREGSLMTLWRSSARDRRQVGRRPRSAPDAEGRPAASRCAPQTPDRPVPTAFAAGRGHHRRRRAGRHRTGPRGRHRNSGLAVQ